MAMGLLSGIRALAWAIVLLMESWKIIQLFGGWAFESWRTWVISIRITKAQVPKFAYYLLVVWIKMA